MIQNNGTCLHTTQWQQQPNAGLVNGLQLLLPSNKAQQADKKEFIFTKYGFPLKRQQSDLQNGQLTLQLD